MADELAEAIFADHVEDAMKDPEASRWSIERREGLVVHVTLSPRSMPDEAYLARLAWADYPGSLPASVVFLDTSTLARGVPGAWPIIAGGRPPNDICATWTAEGFVAHPEWHGDTSKAWDGGDNPVLTQIRHLQHEFDFTYQGRNQ